MKDVGDDSRLALLSKTPAGCLSQNPTKLSGSDKDVVTLTKMRGVHFVKLQ